MEKAGQVQGQNLGKWECHFNKGSNKQCRNAHTDYFSIHMGLCTYAIESFMSTEVPCKTFPLHPGFLFQFLQNSGSIHEAGCLVSLIFLSVRSSLEPASYEVYVGFFTKLTCGFSNH